MQAGKINPCFCTEAKIRWIVLATNILKSERLHTAEEVTSKSGFDIRQIITGKSSPLNSYEEDLFGFFIRCKDKVE